MIREFMIYKRILSTIFVGFAFKLQHSSTGEQPVSSSHRSVLRARLLADQRLVNVRNDATTSDRSLDQAVQFLVSSDGELKMPRRNSFHFEILRSVSGQLEHLSRQVFQDCSAVNRGCGSDSSVGRRPRLKMPVDSSDGKLKTGFSRSRDGLRLHLSRILSSFSTSHFRRICSCR